MAILYKIKEEFDVEKNIEEVKIRFRPQRNLLKAVQDAGFELVEMQRGKGSGKGA